MKARKDPDMLPEGPAKCEANEIGSVKACRALSAVVAGFGTDNRKGILVWNFIKFDTGKLSRTAYGCKSGKFSNEGLVFSFCPFCGTDLRSDELKAEAALSASTVNAGRR